MDNEQNILIVDDKPENLFVLEQMILSKFENISPIQASSGEEALGKLLRYRFALALLDVQMPGMNGYELAEMIRSNKRTKEIPIIFITAAYTDNIHVFKGYESGAVDFLTKPFNQKVLLNKIRVFVELDKQKMDLYNANSQLSVEIKERKKTADKLKQSNEELENTLLELQKTQAHMIHSEKMVSLGSLVAGIAHEINNPINCLSNSVYLVKEQFDVIKQILLELKKSFGEDGQAFLDFFMDPFSELEGTFPLMVKSSNRLKNMVLSLKNFTRHDEEPVKEVSLQKGVESTLDILTRYLSKIEVIKKFGELPLVCCNASEINQVIMNLCTNAINALEYVESPKLIIRTICENEKVFLEFENNGPEIDEKIRGKIFDPFFTTKDVGEGTGLGLAVSFKIIQDHKGQLTFESDAKRTKFILELPVT